MKKELSQKEREEVVTKGFLVDCLDNKKYITESRLEEILDSKNYVTKDYLEERLEKQTKDFYQYMNALMGHHMHMLQVFMENMDNRYVLRREWRAQRGV